MRCFVRWNQAGADWLGGQARARPSAAWRRCSPSCEAADEAGRRVGGEPAEVLRGGEGGAGFFAGFLAMRVCYDLGQRAARPGPPGCGAGDLPAMRWRGPARAARRRYLGPAHVGLAEVLYERNELAAAPGPGRPGGHAVPAARATPRRQATGLALVARIRQSRTVTRPGPWRRWARPGGPG